MLSDPVTTVLARQPRTLGELEAVLGPLGRDVSTEEAWLVRRRDHQGLTFLFVALVGSDLRRDPDPALIELRLQVAGADLRPIAIGVLGPGESRGGETRHDPYHGVTHVTPTSRVWPGAHGVFEIVDDNPQYVFWCRHEPAFAAERGAAEEVDLARRIARMCAGPLTCAALEDAVGPLEMDGSYPQRIARGPTWCCTVRPIEGERLEEVQLELEPPLAAEPLIAALGWPDPIIRTVDVHMTMAVLERASGSTPVELHVQNEGLVSSGAVVPAGRAYEVQGARVGLARWRAGS